MHEQHRHVRVGEHIFDYAIAAVRVRICETIKKAIALRVFDLMIQVAFFFVAKCFAIADEELKIAGIWFIDVRIVNLVDDSVTEREPNAATRMVGRANAFFRARSPAGLDAGCTKGQSVLGWIHVCARRCERQRLIWAATFFGDGAPIARRFASALLTSNTLATSLSKRGENLLSFESETSLTGIPFAIECATIFPTISCDSRKGVPFFTRYSARSVASRFGSLAADCMRLRLIFNSGNIAAKTSSAVFVVSTESKSACLSSCISRL